MSGDSHEDDSPGPGGQGPAAPPEGAGADRSEQRREPKRGLWGERTSFPMPSQWSPQDRDQGRGQDPEEGPEPQPRQRRGPGLGSHWDSEERNRARGPRDAGMSHDGQHLGYGASHHTFHRVHASGSQGANFGSVGSIHQTYVGTGGGRPPTTGHYTARDLDPLVHRYAETGTEERIGQLLASEHVVVLRARSRSGRRTTALYCLDRQLRGPLAEGPRRVSILSPGEDLESVREQAENPDHGPCFLLDATGASWPRTLSASAFQTAFGGFASSGRRLVILIDEPAPSERLRDLVVDHRTPEAQEQVLAHLTDLFEGRHPDPAEHARTVLDRAKAASDGLVPSWIRTMWCPAEAALLTSTLDLWDQGEVPSLAEEVGERRRAWLDQHARELMASAVAERAPWDQAYVLAGAVLNEFPGTSITDAAELLVRVLRGGEGAGTERPEGSAHHFSEPMERRLRHMSTVELEDGRSGLALPQPELGAALLHVAWHDHPRAQRPLVVWLTLLCEHPESEPGVIAAAAQSLAQLAGYAPDLVLDRSVRRWGTWDEKRSPRCLWAAAWLLEKLVFNQSPAPDTLAGVPWKDPRRRIVTKVAVLLRAWADTDALEALLDTDALEESSHDDTGDALFRWMIAMNAYGTRAALVPPIREGATAALDEAARLSVRTLQFALVADDSELGTSLSGLAGSYASTLEDTATEAYRVGLREPVVRELVRWSRERSPDLLLVACNTMLGIAEVRFDGTWDAGTTGPVQPVDGDERPFDLLLWLSTGGDGLPESARKQVRKLWIAALSHPATEREAWRRLFQWDLQAGSPITAGRASYVGHTADSPTAVSPMRDYLTELFVEIYTRPQLAHLRPRLDRYHLLRERIAPDEFPSQQGGPR